MMGSFRTAVPHVLLLWHFANQSCTTAWVPSSLQRPTQVAQGQQKRQNLVAVFSEPPENKGPYIDADFERVMTQPNGGEEVEEEEAKEEDNYVSPYQPPAPKTLIDLSLEASEGEEWSASKTRIPFCRGDEYIDAKLAFMVELEGNSYGIAIPFDDAVAVVRQTKEDSTFVDPDDDEDDLKDENMELMEIMAAQVQQQLGEHLFLRKTPKVLTVSGGLSKITKNWETTIIPKPFTVEELLEADKDTSGDDHDKEVAGFLSFMRKELGDAEVDNALKQTEFDLDPEMIDLFNVPGMDENDEAGMEDFYQSIVDDLKEDRVPSQFEQIAEGTALKLISYRFKGGNSYSLVKYLKPYTLVGRYSEPKEKGLLQFDLLTKEEERVILPKLDAICRKDLENSGLSFKV